MFKKIFKNQIFLTIIVVFLISFFCLNFVSAGSDSLLVSVKDSSSMNEVGRETLEILLTLESLKLDDSLFEETSFKELIDFSMELAEKEVGRENPFKDITFESVEAEI